uniref:Salivary phosphatase n=2 Tax=Ctenocephalides felis TaxID=7515 RepID=I3VPF1_CTEFE
MSRKVYETAFSITSLKRLSAGRYVSHLLDDVDHLRTKGETPDGKKMVLFGTTPPFLKSIMSAMGGDEGYHSENLLPHPEAGSMFITEVYQKVEEQTYHIRLHYSNNPSQPISDKNILKLRGCDELCEFDKFKNLMKPMYLSKDDADKECLE